MADDYYSLLERRIKDTLDDPAELRQVVYEATRLALKRQVLLQQPPITIQECRRLLNDLEDAIARCEADWARSSGEKSTRLKAHAAHDQRMRSDPRSGLRGNRQDSGPIDLDEENEAAAKTNWATRESRMAVGTDARRANGRYTFGESEEDDARTTQARPTSDMRARRDSQSGVRAADRYYRANSRSGFAESGEDESPSWARPTNDGRTRAGSRFDEGAGRRMDGGFRADRGDRASDRDEDGSHPPQDDVVEPPKRPPNRFKDPPSSTEDRNSPSRELVLLPDRNYLVRPDARPPSTDIIYEVPAHPLKRFVPLIWSGARILFQITVVVLIAAVTAFYVTVWPRNISRPAQDAPATLAQDKGRPANPNSPPLAAGLGGGEAAAGAALTIATQPAPAAAPFPYPTSFGIYAISNNHLIELEQVTTAPVDPRTRSTLQIVTPSRSVILDPHLTFIAFRRDFVARAPEKVSVRIAARIAHSMIFDSSGKPVVTTPETETWLIRERGYDLRVAPVRERAEMVALQPDDPEFVFPAGRYELLIGGQHYDFVVAGAVTDPAQCVEGFATVRGPSFYECKAN
jgi:hypothetical protein